MNHAKLMACGIFIVLLFARNRFLENSVLYEYILKLRDNLQPCSVKVQCIIVSKAFRDCDRELKLRSLSWVYYRIFGKQIATVKIQQKPKIYPCLHGGPCLFRLNVAYLKSIAR